MILLIIGIILAILSGIVSLIDKWKVKKDKGYKKNNWLATITFSLILFGSAASFYSGYTSIAEKRKSDSLSVKKDIENKIITEELKRSQATIIDLQKKQLDTSRNILTMSLNINKLQKEYGKIELNYSRELSSAQQKIIQIQSEQTKDLIGDGSKPRLVVTSTGNVLTFFLFNNSEFPILDINISPSNQAYVNIKRMNSIVKANPKIVDTEQSDDIHVGTLRKHAGYRFTRRIQFPVNITRIYIGNEISWTYGSYYSEVTVGKISNNSLAIESIKYYYNNGTEFKLNDKIK